MEFLQLLLSSNTIKQQKQLGLYLPNFSIDVSMGLQYYPVSAKKMQMLSHLPCLSLLCMTTVAVYAIFIPVF